MVFGPFLAGLIIGVIAQVGRGRIGVLWFVSTTLGGYGAWFILHTMMAEAQPARLLDQSFLDAMFLAAAIAAFVVAAIVLFTLPRRASSRPTFKCPHCAELILAEAKVCRFCGREIAPLSPTTVAG